MKSIALFVVMFIAACVAARVVRHLFTGEP
jgi:hypothetical protein